LHVEHSTISNYERGTRKVDLETYVSIANALSVTVKDLTNISVETSKTTENNMSFRKNIKAKSFNKEINIRFFIFKIIFLITFFTISLFQKLRTIEVIIIFMLLMAIIIIVDFISLLIFKKGVKYFSVDIDKDVIYESNFRYTNIEFIKWTIQIIFTYFSIIFITAFVYVGIDLLGEERNLIQLFSIYFLIIFIIFIIVLLLETYRFKLQTSVEYDKFTYKKDLFLFKLTIISSELLYFYTYVATYYYSEILNQQFYWIFLIFTPLLIIITYDLFFKKIKFLSGFELKIKD